MRVIDEEEQPEFHFILDRGDGKSSLLLVYFNLNKMERNNEARIDRIHYYSNPEAEPRQLKVNLEYDETLIDDVKIMLDDVYEKAPVNGSLLGETVMVEIDEDIMKSAEEDCAALDWDWIISLLEKLFKTGIIWIHRKQFIFY